MSQVRYIGAAVPHQEQAVIGSEQQLITVSKAAQVFTFSDAIGTYLVTREPSLWEAAEGWTPPPFEPEEEKTLTVTSNYTLGAICQFLFCNATAGPFTIELPAASTYKGKSYQIVNTATNANLVAIESLGGTISGPNLTTGTTIQIGSSEGFSTVTVVSDGSNWHVV